MLMLQSIHVCRRYLKDCLSLANKEEIMRVSAMALVLLANIYLKYNDVQEASAMLTPAMDVLNKMPDLTLQLWSSQLLRGVVAALDSRNFIAEVYDLCQQPKKVADSDENIAACTQRMNNNCQRALTAPAHQALINVSCPQV